MKSIYDEALEDLAILVKQANARKLSNDIVASRWGVEKITKIIEQAQKQEKLLKLYKELIIVKDEIIIASLFNKSYNGDHLEAKETALEMQIEELENEL